MENDIEGNMKKKTILLLAVLMLAFSFCLTGCDSENLKKAKDSFNRQDYSATIEALDGEKTDTGKAKELLLLSKAHLAVDKENYLEAFSYLIDLGVSKDDAFYKEVVNGAVSHSLQTGNPEQIIEMVKLNNDISPEVIDACNAEAEQLNYKAYICLEGLQNAGINEQITASCSNCLSNLEGNKTKAFMVGVWEWQCDDNPKEQIEVKANKDNLIGYVTVLGESQTEYHIQKGEILWTDFVFMDETSITFNCLCKTRTDVSVYVTALGSINYSDPDTLELHLTAPAPYRMVNADEVWKRVG